MKKILSFLLSIIIIIAVISGCYDDEKPADIDRLLQSNSESETGIKETAEAQNSVSSEDFVSVWPNELPTNRIGDIIPELAGRPVDFQKEIEPGVWVSEYNYNSMYLYDFPDPEQFFHKFGQDIVLSVKKLHFYYHETIEKPDGTQEIVDITPYHFNIFIEALKDAGYNENSFRTETSYYCEKYGIGITIILGKEFPWVEDDPRLAYVSEQDSCFIQLQVIDSDYQMDLESIKAEEYRKWLEKH